MKGILLITILFCPTMLSEHKVIVMDLSSDANLLKNQNKNDVNRVPGDAASFLAHSLLVTGGI